VEEKEVSYDAEKAPAKFTLSEAHRVLLDRAAALPGASGTVTGLHMLAQKKPTQRFKLAGTSMAWDVPAQMGGDTAPPGQVPPLIYIPGKKPSLDLALNRVKYSAVGSRLVVLVGSSNETPGEALMVNTNGEMFSAEGAIIVVDANDRFSLRDLSTRTSWTVTVTVQEKDTRPVPPILLVAQGDDVKLDGKPLVEGYGVLTPGKHRLLNAVSAWVTVPALKSVEVADLDVAFTP
jgi:hypothetical protein